MNKNDVIKILSSKQNSVRVFIPFLYDKVLYDNFVVELFELIEAYFYPIRYGLSKYTILDILVNEEELCDYLHEKRFIVLEKDFHNLVSKYLLKDNKIETECIILEISNNLTEEETTDFLQKHISILADKISVLDIANERIIIKRSL